MSPVPLVIAQVAVRFPRVSGDEPEGKNIKFARNMFSPRERG